MTDPRESDHVVGFYDALRPNTPWRTATARESAVTRQGAASTG